MTPSKQLAEWVKGDSIHNDEMGECCPDFSCCNSQIDTPKEERELFVELVKTGKEKEKMRMLGMFLGRAIDTMDTDKKVYVAGLTH